MHYFHVPIIRMNKEYTHHPLSQRSSSDLSNETLLEKNSHDFELPQRRQRTWRLWALALVVQSLLISMYTVVYMTSIQHARQQVADTYKIDSPAWPSVEITDKVFDYNSTSMDTYFGFPPSDAIDNRWSNLLEYASFKFSEEDMTRWGWAEQGVRLTDNSGYMGTLNVFHELHCLKRVYMYIHKDYYFDPLNLTDYQATMNLRHIMHCMDGIRQGIQCRADISPITYKWNPNAKLPAAEWRSPHQCKNWDTFMSWANENTFDAFEPGLVMHPKYGNPYSGEETVGSKLGILLAEESHDDA